jgi:hypothetical protein
MLNLKMTVAAIALVSVTAPALAEMTDGARYGDWTVSTGTVDGGTPTCGMRLETADGRFVGFKYDVGGLWLQLGKQGWNIPKNTKMDVTMQIDNAPSFKIIGSNNDYPDAILFDYFSASIDSRSGQSYNDEIINEVENGAAIKFSFPGTSEPWWNISLDGSTGAMSAVDLCAGMINTMKKPVAPTQPTQPYKNM